MYSISYKMEKEIVQGRSIDIDDVKTEKCGINYFYSYLACEILTDKKKDNSSSASLDLEKNFCRASRSFFILSMSCIFVSAVNAITIMNVKIVPLI